MAALRPRPASLVLSPPHSWRPSRPTTPLRSTYPLPSSPKIASPTLPIFSPGPSRPSLPPASPLACWRPDTPFSLTTFHSPASPSSPFNPFLLPFYASRSSTLFPIAAPLLPASPLSLWDEAVSPTAAIYRPSHTPSPREAVFADIGTQHSATIMPRFLLLQTPSCMPRVGQASCAFRAKRVNCPDMGAEKEARTTVEMVSKGKNGMMPLMMHVRQRMQMMFYQCLPERQVGHDESNGCWGTEKMGMLRERMATVLWRKAVRDGRGKIGGKVD